MLEQGRRRLSAHFAESAVLANIFQQIMLNAAINTLGQAIYYNVTT